MHLQRAYDSIKGGHSSQKNERTLQSRTDHFVSWCASHHLNPTLTPLDQPDRNFVLALFALDLSTGNTLLAKSIKSATIARYLQAAALISERHKLMDPRKTLHGTQSPAISRVLNELKRWENMPDRKEPVTVAMVLLLAKSAFQASPDSFAAAFYDWTVLGLHYGFRCQEWAIPAGSRAHVPLAPDGRPVAFTFEDLRFFGPGDTFLPCGFEVDLSLPDLHAVEMRWRFQKNNDNGQRIKQVRHPDPRLCCVSAAWRIRHRAQRLNKSPRDVLAVYRTNSSTRIINSDNITRALQSVARKAHNITLSKDITRWTPHSLRIGACVLLNEARVDPSIIKLRLRWRSDAFKDYLRNTITLAAIHRDALIQAASSTS